MINGGEGFEEFFRRTIRAAVATAERILSDHGAAEDAAAEAMIRAHRRWSRLSEAPWRDAWVMRVTINLALDEARKSNRGRKAVIFHPDAGFEDEVVDRLALASAMSRLSKRQRDALALRLYTDLSTDGIAAVMGISSTTVKTYLERGIRALGERPNFLTEEVV